MFFLSILHSYKDNTVTVPNCVMSNTILLGTAKHGRDLRDFRSVGIKNYKLVTDVTLQPGTTYYATIKGCHY